MWFDSLPNDPERPKIIFKNPFLFLSGQCIPENPKYTLEVLFMEIYEFLKFNNCILISFKFDGINSSSSKVFTDLFDKLNDFKRQKKDIQIFWNYPAYDEDMQELGEFYQSYSDSIARKLGIQKITFKFRRYD